jgi:hypothetical protein
MDAHPDDRTLADLAVLRAADLPVHGGRTMAYVYDAGLSGLDDLAARAQQAVAGVNGLDMTAFPSVIALENDLVGRTAAAPRAACWRSSPPVSTPAGPGASPRRRSSCRSPRTPPSTRRRRCSG